MRCEDCLSNPDEGCGAKPEYIYGRIRVIDSVLERFLTRFDAPGILSPSPDAPGYHDGVTRVFACTKEKALELPRDLAALASTLEGLAKDLRHFIEGHPFPNDPKEES